VANTKVKPIPRTKDPKVRLEEIQAAAKELFFKKGYQSTSMDQIASIAGVSKGTVYLYFKAKEDLYISLMINVTQKLGDYLIRFERDLEKGKFLNSHEFFLGLANLYQSVYEYDPEGIRIIQAFQQGNLFSGLSSKILKELDNLARNNFETARRFLSKAKDLGLIQEDINEILVADILWAAFVGIVQLEESKFRATKKNHLYKTLEYGFSLIGKAIGQ